MRFHRSDPTITQGSALIARAQHGTRRAGVARSPYYLSRCLPPSTRFQPALLKLEPAKDWRRDGVIPEPHCTGNTREALLLSLKLKQGTMAFCACNTRGQGWTVADGSQEVGNLSFLTCILGLVPTSQGDPAPTTAGHPGTQPSHCRLVLASDGPCRPVQDPSLTGPCLPRHATAALASPWHVRLGTTDVGLV
jgi:hypothetical protein